jgi:NADH-ubiquinone oxidoreductase chain 4
MGGLSNKYLEKYYDLTFIEFFVNIIILVPVILLGIYPNMIIDYLHISINMLLFNYN